jgi:hypothetical protein
LDREQQFTIYTSKRHINMIAIVIMCVVVQTRGHLHFEVVHSVRDIAKQYFTLGHTLVFSHGTPAHKQLVSEDTLPHRNAIHRTLESDFGGLHCPDDTWRMLLEEFNKLESWPILCLGPNNDFKEISNNKHEAYVLLSECQDHEGVVRDVGLQVEKIRNSWQWNPRGRFVLVVTEIRDVDAKLLAADIFAQLWASRIADSVVLMPTLETRTATLDAYLWFPYSPDGRCPHVKDAVLWNRWISDNSSSGGHFLHSGSLFPPKIPTDVHGCPLTVSTFEMAPMIMRHERTKVDSEDVTYDKGLEVQILAVLAKSTNSTLKYRIAPPDGGRWGWNVGNGTWNGVTGEIARSFSDLGVNCMWYRCHMVKEIECLRPHLIDKVKWYVPCATQYPRWMSLTRVFTLTFWIDFLAAYIIISVIMWQIVKVNRKISSTAAQNEAYTSLSKCLLNFWAIILEESASNNPPDVAVIRTVFFAWVLYCWAVNTVYQTYLTSFLVDPGLRRPLASEDEILASGIDCVTETSTVSIYDGLAETRYKHMKITYDIEVTEERVVKGTSAFLFSKYLVDYNIAVKYMDANGKPRICKVEDDFASTLITIFVPKGCPLKARYDRVLLFLMQAGLLNLWWEKIKYTATLETAGDISLPPGEYVALTTEHLQSAFYFLILGYAVSVSSFLLEIFYLRRKRRRTELITTESANKSAGK